MVESQVTTGNHGKNKFTVQYLNGLYKNRSLFDTVFSVNPKSVHSVIRLAENIKRIVKPPESRLGVKHAEQFSPFIPMAVSLYGWMGTFTTTNSSTLFSNRKDTKPVLGPMRISAGRAITTGMTCAIKLPKVS